MKKLSCLLLCFVLSANLFAHQKKDSVKIDHRKLYKYALDADISKSLLLLDSANGTLSPKDDSLKYAFELRFKYGEDKSIYPAENSGIEGLVSIYKDYWRKCLLNPRADFDTLLLKRLTAFFKPVGAGNWPHATISDSLNSHLNQYLAVHNLHSTGFGKTGRLYDLLVWKTQKDTTYKYKIDTDEIAAPVVFMDGFITLGWEEYATLGRYYPGGWAANSSLFCVKRAYKLDSEGFLISYLAHEGPHLADYKLFPGLGSPALEYRAKLTEISLANSTLFSLIQFFISNANSQSANAHSLADYQLINDLSQKIFNKAFVADINIWKTLKPADINKTAAQLLNADTQRLRQKYAGKELK